VVSIARTQIGCGIELSCGLLSNAAAMMAEANTAKVTTRTSAVVDKLSSLLAENPVQFEITILPGVSGNDDDNKKQVLSLEQSLSLVDGQYLGLDARSLPWMTREIRQEYKLLKKQLLEAKTNQESTRVIPALFQTLSCLLLVNPDHATGWADRRRCLLKILEASTANPTISWRQELDFVTLLMTQHSKA